MLDNLTLSELIVTKICHDLSGPVGAVNNGVELLKEGDASIQERSVELVEISAKEAVARVLFFRQVYGLSYTNSQVDLENLRTVAQDFFAQKNISVHWPDECVNQAAWQGIDAVFGKIVLNSIWLVSGALIHGGNVQVSFHHKSQNGKTGIRVQGEGKGVKLDADVESLFTAGDNSGEVNLKNIQAYVLSLLASQIGYQLQLKHGEADIQLIVQ